MSQNSLVETAYRAGFELGWDKGLSQYMETDTREKEEILRCGLERFTCLQATDAKPEVADEMAEAAERVLVGGNHLALIIGADHPPFTATCGEALEHYDGPSDRYNAWCCWQTIMQLRDVLSRLRTQATDGWQPIESVLPAAPRTQASTGETK